MPAQNVSIPKYGFILAAAQDKKMLPLTKDRPKALIEIANRTLIDRVLDHFVNVGVQTVVINSHYKADIMERHLSKREMPEIVISQEEHLLGSGGGIANCIDILGDGAFYVANADSLWFDGSDNGLLRLAETWDGEKMDALLMLFPTTAAQGYDGNGDYFVDQIGETKSRAEGEVSPYVYAGVCILHSRLFCELPVSEFSLTYLFDRAERKKRLYSIVHSGIWFHVGVPKDIDDIEHFIEDKNLV